ncbi:ankyrin-2 ankyrin [Thecamonas trahens ATCC 50062]|uniref:Ankyrin-2 ankyrin n=1 Tax=Thecamonas trahens ATCC 50062 TaxID=461836 RepID=A0A0L0D5Y5_THETB|nr:ankyrin-2 ankyrin [Thecamonas trahens ATCC 50062]KNC47797.1 ankyrin-2 ankyrin [Thecamonas trahens ATCC 50062]|eukprot:XP_013759275.1 ankyrin-2 ankyrin [Thecamonas trahens ATCC 50062]
MGNSSSSTAEVFTSKASAKHIHTSPLGLFTTYKEKDGIFLAGKLFILWAADDRIVAPSLSPKDERPLFGMLILLEAAASPAMSLEAARRIVDVAGRSMPGPDVPLHILIEAELYDVLAAVMTHRHAPHMYWSDDAPEIVTVSDGMGASSSSQAKKRSKKELKGKKKQAKKGRVGYIDLKLDREDSRNMLPLQLAVMREAVPALDALLAGGANISAANSTGETALHMAASTRRVVSMVSLLLDRGASLESRNAVGNTPLMCALETGNASAGRLIFEAGGPALLASTNSIGLRPLHVAALSGSVDVLNMVLDAGCDPNAPATGECEGLTPLQVMVAPSMYMGGSSSFSLSVARQLLARGAEVAIVAGEASSKGIVPTVEGDTLAHLAVRVSNLPALRWLLVDYPGLFTMVNSLAQVPLHAAVEGGRTDAVWVLCAIPLDQDVGLHVVDANGNTPGAIALARDDMRMMYHIQTRHIALLDAQLSELRVTSLVSHTPVAPSVPAASSASASASPSAPSLSLVALHADRDHALVRVSALERELAAAQAELEALRSDAAAARGASSALALDAMSEEQARALTCCICLDDMVGMAFVPCGHVCCCIECAATVSDCPMCRTGISSRLQVYLN